MAVRVSYLAVVLALVPASRAFPQQEQMIPDSWGAFCVDMCIDQNGNAHLVWCHWNEVDYARFDVLTQSWSSPVPLPYSSNVWTNYGRPKVEVGPNCRAHIIWADITGEDPAVPAPLWYAKALDPEGTQWNVSMLKNDWTAWIDLAVDESNQPHVVYQRPVESGYTPTGLVYLDPSGGETCIRSVAYNPVFPAVGWDGGLVHVAWVEYQDTWYANSSDWSGTTHSVSQAPYPGWYTGWPRMAFKPDGTSCMSFFYDDWSQPTGYHKALCYTEAGWSSHVDLWETNAQILEWYNVDDWWPEIAYDFNANRYLVWTHHDPAYDESFYKINDDAVATLPTPGSITVAAGPAGAMVVRCKPNGGALWWFQLNGGGPTYLPPTAVIDSVVPDPAYQAQDTVRFHGDAWDNDEGGASIVAYEWRSNVDGVFATVAEASLPADSLSLGSHTITFTVWDDESQTASDAETLTIWELLDPTACIDSITPHPAMQQMDTLHFEGSAWDNDEGGLSIETYEWSSSLDGVLSDSEDFDRPADSLSVGTHLITFAVTDDDGQGAQDTMTLLIYPPPVPPTALIDSIVPNPATQEVDTVYFEGSAWDNDENGQCIETYLWHSSLDGDVANQEDFPLPADSLSVGVHLITFRVWDDENQTSQDTVTLVIDPSPFEPPTAVIDSIVPQTAVQEVDTVSFYGSAWDNDEGGQSIETYEWSSDVDGPVGGAEDFSLPAGSLSVGTHLMTFMVWDDESQTAQDTMSITVNPSPFQPPTAVIDSIVPDSANCWVDTICFCGSAWDNDENGDSIETYEWSSDVDGPIGSAEDVSLPADSLSVGSHLITFTVWDDEQQTADDTMTVVVLNPGSVPPTAVIDSIWPSLAMQQQDTVHFRGSAWDNDSTNTIQAYEWWSTRLARVLSTQEDFDVPADSLPLGLNAIRFTVWDDEQDSAAAWGSVGIVEFTPVPAPPNQVECVYEPLQNRVKLTWVGPLGATFNVYHDSTAYFISASAVTTGVGYPPWYHNNPALDQNHFYYLTSENLGGESDPSERVGLVPYELDP